MRWTLLNGREVWKSDKQYKIEWDKPSKSKEQFRVKQFLKKYWFNHIVFEEYNLPSCLLRVDFLNLTKKIAVEHNGAGHADNGFSPYFHLNSRINYLKAIKNDVKKRQILELNGFTVVVTMPEDLDNLSRQWFLDKYEIVL